MSQFCSRHNKLSFGNLLKSFKISHINNPLKGFWPSFFKIVWLQLKSLCSKWPKWNIFKFNRIYERVDNVFFDKKESPERSSSIKFGRCYEPRYWQLDAPIGTLVSYNIYKRGNYYAIKKQNFSSISREYFNLSSFMFFKE